MSRSVRGVKRDPESYPALKEDRYYEGWLKTVLARATLHGCVEVLEPDFAPMSRKQIKIFRDQQTFMWAMLTAKLQTINGKKYMRNHPGDAQEVFKLLHQEYRESLKAEFTSDDQLEKLKSLRISKWTGTYESFLDHFTKQLDLYVEQVAESPSPCHEADKKKYLKDAVAGAAVLAGIHTQENIDVAKGQGLWTYSTYFNLLKAAALEDDRAKNRTSTSKRTVKNLKQRPGPPPGKPNNDSKRVPKEIWKQLPEEIRQIIQAAQIPKKRPRYRANQANIGYGTINVPDNIWKQLPPGVQHLVKE